MDDILCLPGSIEVNGLPASDYSEIVDLYLEYKQAEQDYKSFQAARDSAADRGRADILAERVIVDQAGLERLRAAVDRYGLDSENSRDQSWALSHKVKQAEDRLFDALPSLVWVRVDHSLYVGKRFIQDHRILEWFDPAGPGVNPDGSFPALRNKIDY